MYELQQNMHGSRGSMAEVYIDIDAGLCKKIYKPDGVTITGGKPLHTEPSRVRELFENEIRWSTALRSDQTIEILEHGELPDGGGYYLIQEYLGPDLLKLYNSGEFVPFNIPDLHDQMIEMFQRFKRFNIYKWNNAMSNLTIANGRIKAFDFKYAVERLPEHRDYELYTLRTWISKIDPRLPGILEPYI